jgi:pyruvate/2-oxoglutarate dehydrogenase complex dihydrolipoamide dehydrogenase (E3) component
MTQLTPDLCVIGAGSGGLAVAAGAVQMGASVVLVERARMGGDCLNYGCVPSKSLVAAAKAASAWRRGAELGIRYTPPEISFAEVIDSVHRVIAAIAPNDSVERFESLGATVLQAEARFADAETVEAGGHTIRPRRFVIATGSAPVVPPIPGIERVPFLTNETVFDNRTPPEHLIVIGGGPVGIELAQAHRALGCAVTVIDVGPVMPHDDPELVALLCDQLTSHGIALKPSVGVASAERDGAGIAVTLATGERIAGSHLLVAAGRRPNLAALNLSAAGIETGPKGIVVDRRLRTTNRRAFAIGDAAGGPQFTHVALYHAGIVIRNALFRLPAKVDYRALPWVTYTDPELAQVGLTEGQARARGRVEVLRWPFAENDRARTEHETAGIIKVVTSRRGHILGATILGVGAGDLILPWCLAISQQLNIRAMADLIVPYPTRGEAGKRAAGAFYTPTLFGSRTRHLVRFLARFG